MSDDRLDALFRCEHFSCDLRIAACVERQLETYRIASTGKVWAAHPYCAAACEQGRALAERHPELVRGRERPKPRPTRLPSETTSLARSVNIPSASDRDEAEGSSPMHAIIAERFADQDAARMAELDARIAAGEGEKPIALCPCGCLAPLGMCAMKKGPATPVAAPAEPPADPAPSARPQPTTSGGESAPMNTKPEPADPAKENTMPTGKRTTPCPGCGTLGSKHRQVDGKDCPERLKTKSASAPPKAAPKKPAPAPRAPRAPQPKRPKLRTLEDVASRRAAAAASSIAELVTARAKHLEAVKEIDQELRRQKALLDQALGEAA